MRDLTSLSLLAMPDLADRLEPLASVAPHLATLSLADSPLAPSDTVYLQCLEALTELELHCPALMGQPLPRWPGLAQLTQVCGVGVLGAAAAGGGGGGMALPLWSWFGLNPTP
jgi:hypothetical protein